MKIEEQLRYRAIAPLKQFIDTRLNEIPTFATFTKELEQLFNDNTRKTIGATKFPDFTFEAGVALFETHFGESFNDFSVFSVEKLNNIIFKTHYVLLMQ